MLNSDQIEGKGPPLFIGRIQAASAIIFDVLRRYRETQDGQAIRSNAQVHPTGSNDNKEVSTKYRSIKSGLRSEVENDKAGIVVDRVGEEPPLVEDSTLTAPLDDDPQSAAVVKEIEKKKLTTVDDRKLSERDPAETEINGEDHAANAAEVFEKSHHSIREEVEEARRKDAASVDEKSSPLKDDEQVKHFVEEDDDYSMDAEEEIDEQIVPLEEIPVSHKLSTQSLTPSQPENVAEADHQAADANHLLTGPTETCAQSSTPSIPITANSDYEMDKMLGEGAYGAVYRATHRKSGRQHAIKKLKLTADDDEEDEEMAHYAVMTARREIKVLQSVGSHPNVVEFNETWDEEATVLNGTVKIMTPVLAFELLSMTALDALEMHEETVTNGFSSSLCFSLLRDLCSALDHIHSLNIVHRDVKPENVLLTEAPSPSRVPTLKLCDLGAARHLDDGDDGQNVGELTHYIGSRWYRAPEMMAGCKHYGLKVDVWSAGCILAEFATGQPLFPGEDEHAVLSRIADVVGEFPHELVETLVAHDVPPQMLKPLTPAGRLEHVQGKKLAGKLGNEGIGLLRRMVHPNLGDRASARDCLHSKFLSGNDAVLVQPAVEYEDTVSRDDNASNVNHVQDDMTIGHASEASFAVSECLTEISRDASASYKKSGLDRLKTLVENHSCWSIPGIGELREALLPIMTAGALSAESAHPDSSTRAVPSPLMSQELFSRAAVALSNASPEVSDAWIRNLIKSSPRGVMRTIIRSLRWIIDASINPRVAMCRDWLLAQQQRGELTLMEAVSSVEEEIGSIDSSIAARAAVAARLLQLSYHEILHNKSKADVKFLLEELTDSDEVDDGESVDAHDQTQEAVEKKMDDEVPTTPSDRNAGADIGSTCVEAAESSMTSAVARRDALEERFHVRSVNEALAVVTPMLVDTDVDASVKSKGIARLEALLGLPKLETHAALLRPASKAALLYVALARRPVRRLNLVTSRSTAWRDCESLIALHTSCLNEAGSKAVTEQLRINSIDEDAESSLGEAIEPFSDFEDVEFWTDDDSDHANADDFVHDSSFVICPYYKAPFGQKYVEGDAVEEGEGLGPRKELFSLLAESSIATSTTSYEHPDALTVAPRSEKDSPNVIRLAFKDATRSSASTAPLAAGQILAVETKSTSDVVEITVERVLPKDGNSDFVVRLTSSSSELTAAIEKWCVENGFSRETAKSSRVSMYFRSLVGARVIIRNRVQPLLVHRQDLESLWLNPALEQTAANARRLALLGLLLGSAISNQCQLPLHLPTFFFKALGLAEDCPQNDNSSGTDAGRRSTAASVVYHANSRRLLPRLVADSLLVADGEDALSINEQFLCLLDPTYPERLESMKHLNDADLEALMEMDGLSLRQLKEDSFVKIMNWMNDGDTTQPEKASVRSAYAKRSAVERCCALEWQLRAVRRGFERAIPRRVRRSVRPSARDLQRIVCGAPEYTGDFKFREIFRVVMDAELRECRPLHDALWTVIDGDDETTGCHKHLTSIQRRKLLKFITGVSRLPARHTEFMTIELPYLPCGVDEHRRMLAMIPQSHTCDNILEIPNYWEALLKTRLGDGNDAPDRGTAACEELEDELREIIYAKLMVAIDNAEGYGLDGFESHVLNSALASAAAGDDTASDALKSSVNRGYSSRRFDAEDEFETGIPAESIPDIDDIPAVSSLSPREERLRANDVATAGGVSDSEDFANPYSWKTEQTSHTDKMRMCDDDDDEGVLRDEEESAGVQSKMSTIRTDGEEEEGEKEDYGSDEFDFDEEVEIP